MGAESRAVLATQGRERHSKQEALSHHGEKVDLVVLYFVCIGVVGSLLIHLIEVNTHAFNEWRETPLANTSPRGVCGSGNMDAGRERFKMNRDINGRVNHPCVIKFEIKNGDSNVDVFSGARAAQ